MSKADHSPVLPVDPFEQAMARLIGLPNGAHTLPTVVQDTDFYGNTSQFIVQTFKHEQGETTFLTVIAPGATQAQRFVLTPRVLATIDRQRNSATTMVRRRHGKRIAEERKARGEKPAFMTVRTLRDVLDSGVVSPAGVAKSPIARKAGKKR